MCLKDREDIFLINIPHHNASKKHQPPTIAGINRPMLMSGLVQGII